MIDSCSFNLPILREAQDKSPNLQSPMFHTVIIGKGLMGTAVTRYLAQAGMATAVIGPDEPANWQTHPGVFASHYDQGRITRRLSKDPVWSQLAINAIAQYRYLEQQSGIPFYTPSGGLYVAAPHMDNGYLAQVETIGRRCFQVAYEALDTPELAERFPFLAFPPNCTAVYEPDPAGYINPRDLIRAQLAVAQQHGAAIIRETAVHITPGPPFTITTDTGRTIESEKVVIAAGAFSNCHGLLARPLALRVKTETIILAELPDTEATRLADMPTVIFQIEDPALDSIYLLPPIRYPDGRVYLKMGCNTRADQYLPDLEAMRNWMIRGNSDVILAEMKQALQTMMPSLQAASWHSKRCLITYTASGYPYVDQVADGVFVATGGNGSAAKSSDAIGKLAADLVFHDAWVSDIERSFFTAVYA